MNPDFDITLRDWSAGASPSKDAFLEKLGLDEQSVLGDSETATADRKESGGEEGLILSSGPDEFGISGPGTSTPQRGINHTSATVKIQRQGAKAVSPSEVELPLEDTPKEPPLPSLPPVEATKESPAGDKGSEETLHLQCPQCRGVLVLKRRHLGVEGACVWCHIPLVAADAPREGRVLVFPIHVASATPQRSEASSVTKAPGQPSCLPDSDTRAGFATAELPSPSDGASGNQPMTGPEATSPEVNSAHGFSTGSSELFGDANGSPVLIDGSEFSSPMPCDEKVTDEAQAPPPPALPSSPQVTPLAVHPPAFAKPTRKARNGFLVLMAVVVGFAAGAALASFVLPIEEYVNTARGFMEKTFNRTSPQSQMSTLPSAINVTQPEDAGSPTQSVPASPGLEP